MEVENGWAVGDTQLHGSPTPLWLHAEHSLAPDSCTAGVIMPIISPCVACEDAPLEWCTRQRLWGAVGSGE